MRFGTPYPANAAIVSQTRSPALRTIRRGELIPSLPTQVTLLRSETRDGLTLVLEHVAADSDKTIRQVALRFDEPEAGLLGDWNVSLTDESGAVYPPVNNL